MEQKKKRFRPSLTSYNAVVKELAETKERYLLLSEKQKELEDMVKRLQAEISNKDKVIEQHLEDKSMLVSDCNGWRDKCHGLINEVASMKTTLEDCLSENERLKMSNGRLSGELSLVKAQRDKICSFNAQQKAMKVDDKKGFFSKLFGKK